MIEFNLRSEDRGKRLELEWIKLNFYVMFDSNERFLGSKNL